VETSPVTLIQHNAQYSLKLKLFAAVGAALKKFKIKDHYWALTQKATKSPVVAHAKSDLRNQSDRRGIFQTSVPSFTMDRTLGSLLV